MRLALKNQTGIYLRLNLKYGKKIITFLIWHCKLLYKNITGGEEKRQIEMFTQCIMKMDGQTDMKTQIEHWDTMTQKQKHKQQEEKKQYKTIQNILFMDLTVEFKIRIHMGTILSHQEIGNKSRIF